MPHPMPPKVATTNACDDGTVWHGNSMLKAVVGIEVEVTHLVGKSKLSQNKELRDIQGAGKTLNAAGPTPIGNAMLAVAPYGGQ